MHMAGFVLRPLEGGFAFAVALAFHVIGVQGQLASCRSNQLFDVPTLPLVVVYGSSLIETPAGRVALGLSTWQVRGNSEVAGQNKHQCSYLCKQRWLCPLLLASCRPCFGKERDGRHGWL